MPTEYAPASTTGRRPACRTSPAGTLLRPGAAAAETACAAGAAPSWSVFARASSTSSANAEGTGRQRPS